MGQAACGEVVGGGRRHRNVISDDDVRACVELLLPLSAPGAANAVLEATVVVALETRSGKINVLIPLVLGGRKINLPDLSESLSVYLSLVLSVSV